MCRDPRLVLQEHSNIAAGQKKRQTFISQQVHSFDQSEHDPREDPT